MRSSHRSGILVPGLLLAGMLQAGPVLAGPIVSFSPTPGNASVGNSLFLDLTIAEVTDLFDYQFDITFDPSILRADSISDGGVLTSGGGISLFGGVFTLLLDNTAGVITILDSLLGPAPPETGVTGAGILATLVFTGLILGTSDILFSNTILEDASGVAIDAMLSAGQVTITAGPGGGGDGGGVTPVPEPGTLTLVAVGLACAGLSRRQRVGRHTDRH